MECREGSSPLPRPRRGSRDMWFEVVAVTVSGKRSSRSHRAVGAARSRRPAIPWPRIPCRHRSITQRHAETSHRAAGKELLPWQAHETPSRRPHPTRVDHHREPLRSSIPHAIPPGGIDARQGGSNPPARRGRHFSPRRPPWPTTSGRWRCPWRGNPMARQPRAQPPAALWPQPRIGSDSTWLLRHPLECGSCRYAASATGRKGRSAAPAGSARKSSGSWVHHHCWPGIHRCGPPPR